MTTLLEHYNALTNFNNAPTVLLKYINLFINDYLKCDYSFTKCWHNVRIIIPCIMFKNYFNIITLPLFYATVVSFILKPSVILPLASIHLHSFLKLLLSRKSVSVCVSTPRSFSNNSWHDVV